MNRIDKKLLLCLKKLYFLILESLKGIKFYITFVLEFSDLD